ncbi:hypothetical protein HDU96_003315, partial [Phlyctochytrium bullatum]
MTSPLLHVPDCYLRDAESGEPISVDDFLRRAEQSCSTSPRTFANANVQTHVSDIVTFLRVSDVQHEATKLVSPLIKPKVETAEFSCQTDDPVTLVVSGHDDLVVEPVTASSDSTPPASAETSVGVQTSLPTEVFSCSAQTDLTFSVNDTWHSAHARRRYASEATSLPSVAEESLHDQSKTSTSENLWQDPLIVNLA